MSKKSSAPSAARRWFDNKGWRQLIVTTPYLWMVIFFSIPIVIMIAISVAQIAPTSPPFRYDEGWPWINFESYRRLATDSLFARAYLVSLVNAATTTFFCILIGYPMALGLTCLSKKWRSVVLMLIILPFWTSFLLRVYAWMGLLGSNSWLNRGLTAIYNALVPAEQAIRNIPMMNSNFAVVLVMAYSYLPFMILPLYANLERLDGTLNEAAMDLGSRPWRVFIDVTLPLSVPGIVAGGMLVFIPASGEVVIPSLVGNAYYAMIGRVISDQFLSARDWPMAAAVAVALLVLLMGPIMLYSHFTENARKTRVQA